jgi:hypothetical protein
MGRPCVRPLCGYSLAHGLLVPPTLVRIRYAPRRPSGLFCLWDAQRKHPNSWDGSLFTHVSCRPCVAMAVSVECATNRKPCAQNLSGLLLIF